MPVYLVEMDVVLSGRSKIYIGADSEAEAEQIARGLTSHRRGSSILIDDFDPEGLDRAYLRHLEVSDVVEPDIDERSPVIPLWLECRRCPWVLHREQVTGTRCPMCNEELERYEPDVAEEKCLLAHKHLSWVEWVRA